MASIQTPSTPPPPSRVHSPPTPKHGFSDNWEPFSPRKSARISARKTTARTPSPSSSPKQKSTQITNKSAAMASPAMSPAKKRVVAQPGMLPTPMKTPQRPTSDKTAEIQGVARIILRNDDDILPSPRKRRAKKFTGLSLESFTAEDVEDEPIAIFTDTRDTLPQVDKASNNPFYGEGTRAGPTTRSRGKRVVNIPGEDAQDVDDAIPRDDGIVYVFRGKKKFRKFRDVDDSSEGPAHSSGAVSPSRALTKSSLKPRLLFPPKSTAESLEEEEALTDIEDAPEALATADQAVDIVLATPKKAPKFALASPPTTGRAVRSAPKIAAKPARGVKPKGNLFGWGISKKGSVSHGQKRHAESSASDEAPPKRARV